MDPIKCAVFEIMNRLAGGPVLDIYVIVQEIRRMYPDTGSDEIENLVVEDIIERWGSNYHTRSR